MARKPKVTEQRRVSAAAPRSIDLDARTAEFVASTETVDAHRSIVRQDWKLDRFNANPVVLFNHDSDFPIGTAEARAEEGVGLVAKVRFAEGDPHAERAWNLVRQGVLRGVSVGFRPSTAKFEKHDGEEILVLSGNDLFELSVTSQPSNPEALARSAEKDTMIDKQDAPECAVSVGEILRAVDTVTREAHDAALAAIRATHDAETRCLTSERDELRAKLAEAQGEIAKRDVERRTAKLDALSGRKFAPADRAEWERVLTLDESLFDSLIAKQADIVGPAIVAGNGNGNAERHTDKQPDEKRAEKYLAEVERLVASGVDRNTALAQALRANPTLIEG